MLSLPLFVYPKPWILSKCHLKIHFFQYALLYIELLLSSATCYILGYNTIKPVSAVRELGVVLDDELTMKPHISKVTGVAFYHIRQLKKLRSILGAEITASLVLAFILNRLGYHGTTHQRPPPARRQLFETYIGCRSGIVSHINCSVVVLEESPCPRGLICKSLSLSSDFRLLENFWRLHAFLKQPLCEIFQRKVVLEPFSYLTAYRCWRVTIQPNI